MEEKCLEIYKALLGESADLTLQAYKRTGDKLIELQKKKAIPYLEKWSKQQNTEENQLPLIEACHLLHHQKDSDPED